jgi:cleavage and polyadenylation specificity factor subunit 1
LSTAELKYSAYDRELLAIKLSIAQFRHIIEGIASDMFHVCTDHRPLTAGKNFDVGNRTKTQLDRITRTWSFISEFTTDIRYVPGEDNVPADTMSRAALPINSAASMPLDLLKHIADHQKAAKMDPGPFEPFSKNWDVRLVNGVELVVDIRGVSPRPVVPKTARKTVFNILHGLAHVGTKATRKLIASSYVWESMAKDIAVWVRECPDCQASKVTKHTSTPYAAFAPPSAKFQAVHLDIVGPLPPVQGKRYLLTVIDRFSRFPVAIPLSDITAETCAAAFLSGWIQYFGVPADLVTDRGRQFTSALWSHLMALLGTTHELTTSYHPQSNGQIERFHRTLKAALMSRCEHNLRWMDDLPLVMLGLRAAYKEDLGCSVAEVVFGEPLRLPGACLGPPLASASSAASEVEDYVSDLAQAVSQRSYCAPTWHGNDNSDGHRDPKLDTCSHVYVRVDAVKAPLQRPYQGPFRVVERHDKYFIIAKQDGSTDSVSVDRLKPAFRSIAEATGNQEEQVTRSGRTVRVPVRFHSEPYETIQTVTWGNIERSDAERFAIERKAHVHTPMLDVLYAFEDDELHSGPLLPLDPPLPP